MSACVYMATTNTYAVFIVIMVSLLGIILLFLLVESLTAILAVGIANTQAAHLMGSIIHRCEGALIPILPIPTLAGILVGTCIHMVAPGALVVFIVLMVVYRRPKVRLFRPFNRHVAIFTVRPGVIVSCRLMAPIVDR